MLFFFNIMYIYSRKCIEINKRCKSLFKGLSKKYKEKWEDLKQKKNVLSIPLQRV